MDAERAVKIAEALGFVDHGGEREVIIDDECVGSAWDEHWQDPDGNPILSLPDFSIPEWQIKIQEAVDKGWVIDSEHWVECYCDMIKGTLKWQVLLMQEARGEKYMAHRTGYKTTKEIVYEDALLWQAEQKGK